ncbi:TlpA family protein disulfide reductase [bacterium]|nr:TlpA family protein disulfide reductase [bacterium]
MKDFLKKVLFLSFFLIFSAVLAAGEYHFELYSMSGKLLSSEEIMKRAETKYLIVDFFSLICEPCKKSLPKWEKFYIENRAKGFEFLLVSLPALGDRKVVEKDLKKYFKENKFGFDVVFDKYSVVGKKFGVVEKSGDVTLPMIFVLDKSGKILFKAESYDEAISKIKNLK